MNISVFEMADRLFYEISHYDPILETTLKQNGYSKEDGRYIRSFPLPFPKMQEIIHNFKTHAEEMFYDEAARKPMQWKEGMRHFAALAKDASIPWWTTGKASLPICGIDYPVDDLDFYFRLEDMDAVYKTFHPYLVEPIVSTAGTWRAGSFEYCGLAYSHCPICMFIEPIASLDIPEPVHFGPFAAAHLQTMPWDGYEVKIAPIDLYINTLKRWGNTQRAEAIEHALSQKAR